MNTHKTSYSLLQKNEYNEGRGDEVYPMRVSRSHEDSRSQPKSMKLKSMKLQNQSTEWCLLLFR
jgi:hypothetical protein